jgi:hypothetical protein
MVSSMGDILSTLGVFECYVYGVIVQMPVTNIEFTNKLTQMRDFRKNEKLGTATRSR